MLIYKKDIKKLHGQSVLEYVLLIGIITVALFASMQMVKRATQSIVKVTADELGAQRQADQFTILANGDSVPSNRQGYLDTSNTMMFSENEKRIRERIGVVNYIYNDAQMVVTDTLTNMGFTEESR
jgi:archaellum component FlaF (FlaF/FlaG flagellin family)